MSIAAVLIPFLAEKVLAQFKTRREVTDLDKILLDMPSLITGLTRLNVADSLVNAAAKITGRTADAITPEAVQAAIDDIKTFQEKANLKVDGILGPKTLEIIQNILRICPDPKPPVKGVDPPRPPGSLSANDLKKLLDNLKPGDRINPFEVRVFYESLPPVLGADGRPIGDAATEGEFQSAFNKWSDHCGVTILKVGTKAAADVVVQTGEVDGTAGPELANANIGPPDALQLTIVFDIDEKFTKDVGDPGTYRFKSVAVHEIGHLLGLHHVNEETGQPSPKGQVMFAMYQPEMDHISDADKLRIQRIFGQPPQGAPDNSGL